MRICAVSQDAKYLAYGLSSNGSDWITIKVMQVENKTIELDTVSWVSTKTFINLLILIEKDHQNKIYCIV